MSLWVPWRLIEVPLIVNVLTPPYPALVRLGRHLLGMQVRQERINYLT